MGVEHSPVFTMAWIDAEGRSELNKILTRLYDEGHIDHAHMAEFSEADANHFLDVMKRYGRDPRRPLR